MKYFRLPVLALPFVTALLVVIVVSCNETPKQGQEVAAATSGYTLVWSDEFDGPAIDTTSWVFEKGGHGWGNNEQEYYTEKNAATDNGMLVITARKEQVDKNPYTSARMITKGRREFQYGRIESRIKIPVGQGLWPAFWMMGANFDTVGWAGCGEIDIMEHINTDSLLYGTLHWDSAGHVMKGDTIAITPSDFHVYAIEWDASSIKWFVDSIQYHEMDISGKFESRSEFHQPAFLLLNLAIGGNWPGQVIDESKIPAAMYVDYVRVYQKKG